MQTSLASDSHPQLEVGHLFRRGWQALRENLGLALGTFVVYVVLTNLAGFFEDDSTFGSLMGLVSLFLWAPLSVGLYWLDLKLIRGESAEFGTLFSGFQDLGRSLGVVWLMGLATGIGLVLLIVPGVIAAIGLFPSTFLVKESRLGSVDCLKRAWELTDGHKMSLFVLGLAILGLNLLGLIALLVGVLFTGALSLLIVAAAYDELVNADAGSPSRAETSGITTSPPPIS